LLHEELLARSLPLLLRHDRGWVHGEISFPVFVISVHFHCSFHSYSNLVSAAKFFLRDTLTASAVSPPVDTAPATISPRVEIQIGHIVSPLRRQSYDR